MTSTIDLNEDRDTNPTLRDEQQPPGGVAAAPSTVWYLTLAEWWRSPQSTSSRATSTTAR